MNVSLMFIFSGNFEFETGLLNSSCLQPNCLVKIICKMLLILTIGVLTINNTTLSAKQGMHKN